jgi:hypothetical protein
MVIGDWGLGNERMKRRRGEEEKSENRRFEGLKV